jgi:hypothetical protein
VTREELTALLTEQEPADSEEAAEARAVVRGG